MKNLNLCREGAIQCPVFIDNLRLSVSQNENAGGAFDMKILQIRKEIFIGLI